MRWYALSNRPWVEEADGFGFWGLPPGTIGSIDLAPAGSQSHVFVTSDAPFGAGAVAVAIGDGTRLDAYVPTAEEQSAWQSLVGVACEPGWTLLDLLWETLTAAADPDGLARAKPIMPTHRGVLELHLGGHSLVRAEKLPADPTEHRAWPNIQRVLQNDYRAIQARDRTLARKWLGAQQGKYRLSPEAASDLLIPADLPRALPLKPTTTITDDFNRADGSIDGTGPSWTWSVVVGSVNIASNQVTVTGIGSARAESDLSSDDHYSQATIETTGNVYRGPAARFDAVADTYYSVWLQNGKVWLSRTNAGAGTLLQSANATHVFGAVLKCQADGSTISLTYDGVELISLTDSSISGNLRAGLGHRGSGSGSVLAADNFEAADLLAETVLVRVRSENLGTGEAQLRARGRTSAYDEGLAVDQVVQRLRELARRRGEGVALADMSTVVRALSRFRNETAGLIETTAFAVEALAEALVRVLAETVTMAEALARPRRLARIRAELVGMAGAVARVGGFVSAVVPVITSRIRMRVGPSIRMNVPPARR